MMKANLKANSGCCYTYMPYIQRESQRTSSIKAAKYIDLDDDDIEHDSSVSITVKLPDVTGEDEQEPELLLHKQGNSNIEAPRIDRKEL